MDDKTCVDGHDWASNGIVYAYSDRPLPGSGAHAIEYFENYFCKRCLEKRYISIGVHGNSYEKIRYDAHPK